MSVWRFMQKKPSHLLKNEKSTNKKSCLWNMQGLEMRSVKLMAQSRWKQTSGVWRRNEAHVVRPPKPINCATRPACANQIQPLPLHPCALRRRNHSTALYSSRRRASAEFFASICSDEPSLASLQRLSLNVCYFSRPIFLTRLAPVAPLIHRAV